MAVAAVHTSTGGSSGVNRSHRLAALRESPLLPEGSPVVPTRSSGRVTRLSERALESIATEALLANRPDLAAANAIVATDDVDADFTISP